MLLVFLCLIHSSPPEHHTGLGNRDSVRVVFRDKDFCSSLIKEVAKPQPKLMNGTKIVSSKVFNQQVSVV